VNETMPARVVDEAVARTRSRVNLWLRAVLCSVTALVVAASLVFLSPPSAAQYRLYADAKSSTCTMGGVQFRVPASYKRPPVDSRNLCDRLYFAFWVSDGKPEAEGVPPLGSKERIGRGYWPPEPGRPAFSSTDFLVFVLEAVPLDRAQGLARQRWPREMPEGNKGLTTREDNLECRSYPTGHKDCFTPLGDDPDVRMWLGFGGDLTVWNMNFYSIPDSMWVKLNFPGVGQSRWSEVVCRTLFLIRSWRISGGPPPPDCSRLPRLSSF
jgi:hypothetical protein